MLQLIGETLCIDHAELTNGMITPANLKNMIRRGDVRRVQRGGNGRQALYAVESFPAKLKAEVYHRYPDYEEKESAMDIMERITIDGEASQFYSEYTFPDGTHLPNDKQIIYTNNCSILKTFGEILNDTGDLHRSRGKRPIKKKEFWGNMAKHLPRFQEKYQHTLPENPRRLEQKYYELLKNGYERMISKNFKNDYVYRGKEKQESLLMELCGHNNNLNAEQIAGIYNNTAQHFGWKPITSKTVLNFKKKNDIYLTASKHGEKNLSNKKNMQVKRCRPDAPFKYITLDGWVCELAYRKTTTDKSGHNKESYHHRLTLEVILDTFNDYPIGYAIGEREDAALITEALKNAARHSEELFGTMYRFEQLQSDRNALKAMTPIYGGVARLVTPAHVGNAKSKVVERYFRYLNTTYCQMCENWTGFGVTTNPDRQPNIEAMNRKRKTFPTKEELIERIHEMMRIERAKKIDEYRKAFNSEHLLPLPKEEYLHLFGAETGRTNRLTGAGIKITLLGHEMTYDSYDINFRKNNQEQWHIKYDPDDLQEVLAESGDGTKRFMLQQKHIQPMAIADQSEEDRQALQKVRVFNKELKEHIIEKRNQTFQEALPYIQQDSLLGRLLLTDSDGQHKLNRDSERLSQEYIDALEVNVLEAHKEAIVEDEPTTKDVRDYDIF